MGGDTTRYSVFVKTRHNVPTAKIGRANLAGMKPGWFDRLIEAIQADGRDLKAISRAAGCGQNYVQQMIKDRKEPGTARFVRLLQVLGRAQSLYIILGADMTPEDEEIFQIASSLDPKAKKAALDLFRALPHAADNQEQ